jgi:hypothetical protein
MALCTSLLAVVLAAPGDATGTWTWSVTTPGGETFAMTLKLKQDADKLTGTLRGRNNIETAIEEGKIEKDVLTFKVTRIIGEQRVDFRYSGTLMDGTIKGSVEFERDGEKQMRDWEAKRAVEKGPAGATGSE